MEAIRPISIDNSLLSGLQSGVRDLKFSQLHQEHAGKVYSVCLAILKDEATAKDATQEIFIRAFLKFSCFRNEAKFSTWLISISRNYCIDYLRKQQRRRKTLTTEEVLPIGIIDEQKNPYLVEMKMAELRKVLQAMPWGDRRILLMKFQEQMSIKEIALALHKSEGAIKMSIRRAKAKARKLRSELELRVLVH